ncbi:MAG: DUF3750 domain-containing protein [Rhodospirillales bacterium]|nr:DUF3750 domain-containing protein [Rhodospirillales bacterium]
MRTWKFWRRLGLTFLLVIAGSAVTAWDQHKVRADWRTASRESTGIAPDPAKVREAVIQVYGARAFNWRGYFGVHTWIAVKPTDAEQFTIYEVMGWRARSGQSVVAVSNRAPDGRWFGAAPEILADMRGAGVDDLIRKIDVAAHSYPYDDTYTIWPGPNSNTFVAHVARAVPELRLDLPPTAIGKDYIPGGKFFAETPSGTGYQFSLYGLLGLMVAKEEGIEINLLGLTFGLDLMTPALKLPMAGRIGADNVIGG